MTDAFIVTIRFLIKFEDFRLSYYVFSDDGVYIGSSRYLENNKYFDRYQITKTLKE